MTSQTAKSHSFWRRTHKALHPKLAKIVFWKHEKMSFIIENNFLKITATQAELPFPYGIGGPDDIDKYMLHNRSQLQYLNAALTFPNLQISSHNQSIESQF